MSMREDTYTVTSGNLTIDDSNLPFSHSIISNNEDSIWVIWLHKIQLVLTIVGFIANIVTSITLIKTGQVSMTTRVIIDLVVIKVNR